MKRVLCWLGGSPRGVMAHHPWASGRFAQVGRLVVFSALLGAVPAGVQLSSAGAPGRASLSGGLLIGLVSAAVFRYAGALIIARGRWHVVAGGMAASVAVACLITLPVAYVATSDHAASPWAMVGLGLLILLQLSPMWASALIASDVTVVHALEAASVLREIETLKHADQSEVV